MEESKPNNGLTDEQFEHPRVSEETNIEYINVFLIERSTMGERNFMHTAYLDIITCQIACDTLKEEWVSYEPKAAKGEKISGNRVIVSRFVYSLDSTEGDKAIKIRALSKLTQEEREALGL